MILPVSVCYSNAREKEQDPRVDLRIRNLFLVASDLFLRPSPCLKENAFQWTVIGRLPSTLGEIEILGTAAVQMYDLEDQRLDSYKIFGFTISTDPQEKVV